jgi:hypothetical protein
MSIYVWASANAVVAFEVHVTGTVEKAKVFQGRRADQRDDKR